MSESTSAIAHVGGGGTTRRGTSMSAQLAQAEATQREGIGRVKQNMSSASAPTVYFTQFVAVEVQHIMHFMQKGVLQRFIRRGKNTSHALRLVSAVAWISGAPGSGPIPIKSPVPARHVWCQRGSARCAAACAALHERERPRSCLCPRILLRARPLVARTPGEEKAFPSANTSRPWRGACCGCWLRMLCRRLRCSAGWSPPDCRSLSTRRTRSRPAAAGCSRLARRRCGQVGLHAVLFCVDFKV